MHPRPLRTSNVIAWSLASLLVVLPLLYFLSVPPIIRHVIFNPATASKGRWVLTYVQPYLWCQKRPLLQAPLSAYSRWWMRDVFNVTSGSPVLPK